MRISVLVAAAAVATAIAAPASAATNLLTNGSFESRVVTAGDICESGGGGWCVRSFASTPGWTQTGNGVDLIGDNYYQGPAGYFVLNNPSQGLNFLDMNQAGNLGGLYQEVSATAGETYNLFLDISAWAQNSIPGTVGYDLYDPFAAVGSFLAQGSFSETVENTTWDTLTLSAVATSNKIGVRIYGVAARQAGMGVDNVVLTGAGVPEPSGWALSIMGFGLMGAALRRRGAAAFA